MRPSGCWKNTGDFYPNSLSSPMSVSQPVPARRPPPATPRKPAAPAARAAGGGCRKLFTPRTEKFALGAQKPLTPNPTLYGHEEKDTREEARRQENPGPQAGQTGGRREPPRQV